MSDETCNTTGTISLERHFDRILDEREKFATQLTEERDRRYTEKFAAKDYAVEIATRAARDASEKALSSVDRRLEAMNEFRGSLNDMIANNVTKAEYAGAHAVLQEKIDRVVTDVDSRLGSINKWLIGLMGGVIATLILTILNMATKGLLGD